MFVVGSVALVTLAGCGRGWFQFAEREPWRREAEIACLKSGTVREGVNIVRAEPISGPGICGADYPLKVAALGSGSALGFADYPRPPASVPGALRGQPAWPLNPPPQPPQPQPVAASPGTPVSLSAPGVAPPPADDEMLEAEDSRALPQAAPLPRLGPPRPAAPQGAQPVALQPTATLACPLVSELDRWIAESVQPAALRWFGAPVGEIKQISAYSCRGMNGSRSAHISEHAFGNALDIAAFTLVDGRRISVKDGWNGLPEEQGFLRDVQGAACQQFSTVLAPGSNVYHYDHIHVDLMRRASGRVICQPGAVSGEAVAARAMQRGRYAARDPGITGALGRKLAAPFRRPSKDRDDDDWIEDESHIK